MRFYLFCVVILLFHPMRSICGITCSKSTPVEPITITYHTRISLMVGAMPLEHVLINYQALTGPNALTMDTPEFNYFKECIMLKFESNRDQILKMVEDSNHRYRMSVQAPKAHTIQQKRKKRRQRLPSKVRFSQIDDSKHEEA